MSVSRTGTTPTPFGFVGKAQYQTDSDSGLQLLGHRYYDPSIGRFLSSDPAQAGTNWYAYCENNPLVKTDPEGLDDLTPIEKGIIHGTTIAGTVIGGFSGGAGGAAGGTIIEPGGGTLIGGGAGAVYGAGQGAIAGAAIGTALVALGRLIRQIGDGGSGSGGGSSPTSPGGSGGNNVHSDPSNKSLPKDWGKLNASQQSTASDLIGKFVGGNKNPGIGNGSLGSNTGISYLLGRDGTRVFIKLVGKDIYEIVGYANKNIEPSVIGRLLKTYGGR